MAAEKVEQDLINYRKKYFVMKLAKLVSKTTFFGVF
jgi:hypothetical protein